MGRVKLNNSRAALQILREELTATVTKFDTILVTYWTDGIT